jgi:hypothetical protein
VRLTTTSAAVLGPFVVVAVVGFGRRPVVAVTITRVWVAFFLGCGAGTALAFCATLITRKLVTIRVQDISQ